jgi:hypothetical protein
LKLHHTAPADLGIPLSSSRHLSNYISRTKVQNKTRVLALSSLQFSGTGEFWKFNLMWKRRGKHGIVEQNQEWCPLLWCFPWSISPKEKAHSKWGTYHLTFAGHVGFAVLLTTVRNLNHTTSGRRYSLKRRFNQELKEWWCVLSAATHLHSDLGFVSILFEQSC